MESIEEILKRIDMTPRCGVCGETVKPRTKGVTSRVLPDGERVYLHTYKCWEK